MITVKQFDSNSITGAEQPIYNYRIKRLFDPPESHI